MQKSNLLLRIIGWIFVPYIMLGVMVTKETNSKFKGILSGFISFIFIFGFYGSFGDSDTNTSEISNLKKQVATLENKIDKQETKEIIDEVKSKEPVKLSAKPSPSSKPSIKPSPSVKPSPKKPKEYTLSNGNYYAGKDFEEGIYDIVAISGNGNVMSDNQFSGGINAIMGVSKDDMYQQEYKNIELPDGTKLQIMNVKVKLIKK